MKTPPQAHAPTKALPLPTAPAGRGQRVRCRVRRRAYPVCNSTRNALLLPDHYASCTSRPSRRRLSAAIRIASAPPGELWWCRRRRPPALQTLHPAKPGAWTASPVGWPPLRWAQDSGAGMEHQQANVYLPNNPSPQGGELMRRAWLQHCRAPSMQRRQRTCHPRLLRAAVPGLEKHCCKLFKVAQHRRLDLQLEGAHRTGGQIRAASVEDSWTSKASAKTDCIQRQSRNQVARAPHQRGGLCKHALNGGIRPGPRPQLRPALRRAAAEARVLPHAPVGESKGVKGRANLSRRSLALSQASCSASQSVSFHLMVGPWLCPVPCGTAGLPPCPF